MCGTWIATLNHSVKLKQSSDQLVCIFVRSTHCDSLDAHYGDDLLHHFWRTRGTGHDAYSTKTKRRIVQPVKSPLIQETQEKWSLLCITCMNGWQVIFSQVRLVDHVNIHGGGAVDEGAPVREKLRNQQSVFTDNINLPKRVQTFVFVVVLLVCVLKLKLRTFLLPLYTKCPETSLHLYYVFYVILKGGSRWVTSPWPWPTEHHVIFDGCDTNAQQTADLPWISPQCSTSHPHSPVPDVSQ